MIDSNSKTLSSLLVLFASINFSGAAMAQTAASGYETPNDVFERAFFRNDPNFYANQTFRRQIDLMFGPGSLLKNSFPENEIARDAELVNTLYRDALTQQTTNDPYIRTPDLPNPYNTSLLMSPHLSPTKLQTGTEFRFETVPPR